MSSISVLVVLGVFVCLFVFLIFHERHHMKGAEKIQRREAA